MERTIRNGSIDSFQLSWKQHCIRHHHAKLRISSLPPDCQKLSLVCEWSNEEHLTLARLFPRKGASGRSAPRIDTGFGYWLNRLVTVRKTVLILSCVAVAALVVIVKKASARTSVSFSVASMEFSSVRGPLAYLAITNSGTIAAKWGYAGGWIEVQTPGGSITNDLHAGGIIEPGAQLVFPVRLPPETRRWRVRCVVSQASTSQRVSFRLGPRWDGKIRLLGRELLSHREGAREIICSPLFNAENFVQTAAEGDSATKGNDLTRITDIGL